MSAERVNVQAMRLEAGAMRTSHWWAEHAEALAALLDVADAARAVEAAEDYSFSWDEHEKLRAALARLDFGDAA